MGGYGVALEVRPPWLDDPEPDNWVSLGQAARMFRKSKETIRLLVRDGVVPGWYDGSKWWVRLNITPIPTDSPISSK